MSFGIVIVGVVLASAALLLLRRRVHRPRERHIVRVLVDDFVVGDLPMLCVKTGMPADGVVDFTSNEDKFRPWWILLLAFGPFGILAMIALYVVSPNPRRVGGSLPMTAEALESRNRRVSLSNRSWLVPVVGLALGSLILPISANSWASAAAVSVLVLGLIGGFVLVLAMGWTSSREDVQIALDGTGRWVEIRNVHSDFAAAANRRVRDDHRARRLGPTSHDG